LPCAPTLPTMVPAETETHIAIKKISERKNFTANKRVVAGKSFMPG
jgi:hypothetical protein